ncbi:9-divinyl ether synthase [Trichoplax sp. H2]|nr:9-divinyl ether synthase [Trichoplax sp. H2]|eukprot:RDD38702.1 9-divinyl ether synthase [Trichoplax sp. H2]
MKVEPVNSDDNPKKVANSLGWTIPSVMKLLKEGNLYFKTIQEKTGHTIFRINLGVEAFALCDSQSATAVFDYSKVTKDDGFGRLKFNKNLTGQIRPSIFCNGEVHERYRKFLMDVFRATSVDYLIKVTNEAVEKHFSLWEKSYTGAGIAKEWEMDILRLCSDIVHRAILGGEISSEASHNWLMGILKKKRSALGVKTKFFSKAIVGYAILTNGIKESPHYQSMIKLADKRSVSEEEALNNILFSILFNYYGGCSAAFRTCAARISILDENIKSELIEDIKSAINKYGGLTGQALCQMRKLHSFVLENLRMSSPVNLIFGRAVEDLMVKSNTGTYKIPKGKLMVANLFWAHRDTRVFDDPLTFQALRFFNNPDLKNYLYWEAGPFSKDQCEKTHQCPGRNIAIPSIMLFSAYLLLQGDYQLGSEPQWTGKKIRRLGTPDEIITLKKFKYKSDVTVSLPEAVLNSKLKYDEMTAENNNSQCPVDSEA